MDEITPVLVCGMGRSGTTNALRVLNTHPAVALNGEIPLSILKHFFALLDGIDRSYEPGDKVRDAWLSRKADYMFESFGYLSKGGRGKLNKSTSAQFRGHKSPRLENFFEKYESHFAGAGPMPRYFYCARNPFDCWRSYREMPWCNYSNVEQFLQHYVASFSRLKLMQEIVSDRIVVLNLDDLTMASDLFAYYREKIFFALGLELPERSTLRIEKIEGGKESTVKPELNTDDKMAIESYPGIAEITATHFPRAASASR